MRVVRDGRLDRQRAVAGVLVGRTAAVAEATRLDVVAAVEARSVAASRQTGYSCTRPSNRQRSEVRKTCFRQYVKSSPYRRRYGVGVQSR